MTHTLDTFTDLLPARMSLDEMKADFLRDAETTGIADYLRARAVSPAMVEARVQEEITDLMTAQVAEIVEARGLIEQDLVDLLGFVHEDPSEAFVAAVRDAVQVSFVYDAAHQRHRLQERRYDHALKTDGRKEEVQKFVKELATDHPSLAGPPTGHALDEVIATLHASAPWMRDLSTWIYKALRARYSAGQTWLTFPPVILIGPPGCGKTTYAGKLAALSGTSVRKLDAAASNASFTVVGSDATWAGAQAGVPLQEIAKTGIANPIMIVDEIEKAGTMTTSGGGRVSLPEALLGLLEPSSATSWECPYTRRSFNMSQISWIMTANTHTGIPAPLLDRCRVFDIGYPEGDDLVDLIRSLATGRIYDQVTDRLIARVLIAVSKGRPPSLRRISQLIDEAAAVGRDPVLH